MALRSPWLWLSLLSALALTVAGAAWWGTRGALGGGAVALGLLGTGWGKWRIDVSRRARAARAVAQGEYRRLRRGEEPGDFDAPPLEEVLGCFSPEVGASLRRIAQERDRVELVLAAMIDGVVALDRRGRLRLLNRAAEKIFSLSGSHCLGKPLDQVCPSEEFCSIAEKALRSARAESGEFGLQERVYEVYATSAETQGRLVLVIRDVTEKRGLEGMRRDFVANVSHELKTPLTSIRAYVETLLDGGLEDSRVNERFLRKIDRHAARLGTLITDLLILSRLESGQTITQRVPVDLTRVLRDSFERFRPPAEGKGLRIELEVPPGGLSVLGDMEALLQIFDNLISNAVNYTESGGKVVISGRREGDRVLVAVRDSGVGIPPADVSRVFERFYRVDRARSREQGGTGLGLSIVKHHVQALQGEITLESRLGEGTRFEVKLPAA